MNATISKISYHSSTFLCFVFFVMISFFHFSGDDSLDHAAERSGVCPRLSGDHREQWSPGGDRILEKQMCGSEQHQHPTGQTGSEEDRIHPGNGQIQLCGTVQKICAANTGIFIQLLFLPSIAGSQSEQCSQD